MKKAYFFLFFQLLIVGLVKPQNEVDSTLSAIDSLLNQNYEHPKYLTTASKYAQTEEEAPSAISIVTSGEIEKFGYHNLADLLNMQTGMYVSNDRALTYLGVRGFRRLSDNNRTLILIDGHRINSYQVGGGPIENSLGLDLKHFEKVEIVRGPGSALYGTNALFAVINLVPKQIEKPYPAISANYGSFDSKEISLQFGNVFFNKLNFTVLANYYKDKGEDFYYPEFDTPRENNGWAINQDGEDSYGGLVSLEYSKLKFTGMFNHRKKLIPTGSYNSEFSKEQNIESTKGWLELKYQTALSYNKEIFARISYDYDVFRGILPLFFGNIYIEGVTKTLSGEAQLLWDIMPNYRFTLGTEYKNSIISDYKFGTKNYTLVNGQWPYQLFSAYLQNEYQFSPKLLINAGIRMDAFLDESDFFITPRAAVVYSPTFDNTLKLIYGTSFRSPNVIERNLEEKTIVGYKKNLDLTAEKINTLEFIWEHKFSEAYRLNMSLFYYKLTDIIDQVKDTNDNYVQYRNFSQAKAYGLEFELERKFSKKMMGYIRYTYQNAKDNKRNDLVNSPKHLARFGVTKEVLNFVNIAMELQFESSRKTLAGTFANPIYLVNMNFVTKPIFNYFTLSLRVKNLFDFPLYYPGSIEHRQNLIRQPGRSFWFTFGFDFE